MSIIRIFRKVKKTPIKYVRRKVLLAGVSYSISLVSGSRNSCKREGDTLIVTLSEMTRENFESYFSAWYRREARKLFKASISKWLVVMERFGYDVPDPRIKVFQMRRAWGRCYYTKGLITINLSLAAAPLECIDLITLHELCHFLEHSHSQLFYAFMTNLDPDWRKKEQLLKDFATKNRRALFK